MHTILEILPANVRRNIIKITGEMLNLTEEIRLRINRPIEVTFGGNVSFGDIFYAKEAELFLARISQFSFYMLEEQFRRGYITISGGHRIGMSGRVVLEGGAVKGLREISSFNIRIAKEKLGVCASCQSYLYQNKKWLSTMIIGAPQTGKTTYLRDIARIISHGNPQNNILPHKVGIVDERSEIAGCVGGIPQLTFGNRIDILDGCPKSEGMMMLIRSMSPDVIVADEIGRPEDVYAIFEAINAGISLIVSAHGENFHEIHKRPTIGKLLESGAFKRIIELKRTKNGNFSFRILDKFGKEL